MGMATRHLGMLVIAAAGILTADSADAGWYTYEIQVHYSRMNGGSEFWMERETFDNQADAMDVYYSLLTVAYMGYLDDLYPAEKQGYIADDMRLVRYEYETNDNWGEEWIHLHYQRYWQSLQPGNSDDGYGGGYYGH